MRRHLAPLLLIAIFGVAIGILAGSGVALAQSTGGNGLDLIKGIFQESHILSQLPRALPAYVAGFCGVVLLGQFLGFYEIGIIPTVVLLAIIGGIVYRFYIPH